jgi:hypothetical protein
MKHFDACEVSKLKIFYIFSFRKLETFFATQYVLSGLTYTPGSQNVTYTVVNRNEKGSTVHLLNNVSGYFLPQRMFALVRAPVSWNAGGGGR